MARTWSEKGVLKMEKRSKDCICVAQGKKKPILKIKVTNSRSIYYQNKISDSL